MKKNMDTKTLSNPISAISMGVIGLFLTYKSYKSYKLYHVAFVFDYLIVMTITFIGALLLLYSLHIDIKLYKVTNTLRLRLITVLCILFAVVVCLIHASYYYKFHKSSLILANYKSDLSGMYLDLKVDGSYILTNNTSQVNQYVYGRYRFSKQKIYLGGEVNERLKLSLNGKLTSRHLMFHEVCDVENRITGYLVQTTDKGRILKSQAKLEITENNRNEKNHK